MPQRVQQCQEPLWVEHHLQDKVHHLQSMSLLTSDLEVREGWYFIFICEFEPLRVGLTSLM